MFSGDQAKWELICYIASALHIYTVRNHADNANTRVLQFPHPSAGRNLYLLARNSGPHRFGLDYLLDLLAHKVENFDSTDKFTVRYQPYHHSSFIFRFYLTILQLHGGMADWKVRIPRLNYLMKLAIETNGLTFAVAALDLILFGFRQ